MVKNGTVIYAEHPTDAIIPGVTLKYVEEDIDLNAPLDGGVLIKTVALSSDPYMRYRMRDPKVPNFSPHLTIGAPVDNFGVGVVVRSEDPNFKAGDFVEGYLEFREYSRYPAPKELQHFLKYLAKNDRKPSIPASVYTGTLGLAGKSAFGAIEGYAKDKIKQSKTIFVSGAAGPVGTFVCEYAKVLNPDIKVIGTAGSADKIDILKKIGVDVPINYKTQNILEVLREHAPIDVYWDNVAGSTLDAALDTMNMFGLIIACGAISQAGGQDSYVKNFELVFQKSITIHGFLVGFGETTAALTKFYETVEPLILAGKITSREHKFYGLQKAAEALESVHTGANTGKSVIIVSEL